MKTLIAALAAGLAVSTPAPAGAHVPAECGITLLASAVASSKVTDNIEVVRKTGQQGLLKIRELRAADYIELTEKIAALFVAQTELFEQTKLAFECVHTK